jgi:hypothetical protein
LYAIEEHILTTGDTFVSAFGRMLNKEEFLLGSAVLLISAAAASGWLLKFIFGVLSDERIMISGLGASLLALWLYIHSEVPNWNADSLTGQTPAILAFAFGLALFPWFL